MRLETLAIVRCPYCGGRVDVKDALFHRREGDDILDAVLGCHCCHFVIVSGIAVMTVEGQADTARQQVEAGQPDAAARTMLGIEDEAMASRLEDPSATYRAIVDALGTNFEGGYFLYRFSDPTFVVADGVARSLAAAAAAHAGSVVDLCGGSGHLTRTLSGVTGRPALLMDLSFVKLWLARRFTAVGCEAVCADAHAPLPFASGAFRLAVCNDAFHYIWTKALFAREMMRVIDASGVAAVTHVHNAEQWNPSAGNPLPPSGYRDLFEGTDVRVFAERLLLRDVMDDHVDLGRRDSAEDLNADPALTVVASRRGDVFVNRRLERPLGVREAATINPLYAVTEENGHATLRLRFPSTDYEEEYGACRLYLPEVTTIDQSTLRALESGAASPEVDELLRRRIVLDLPQKYL